jgi:thiosulfate dehydrogenase [quinone] large subunit
MYLGIRLYVAYKWLESALPKIGDPAWTSTGEAMKQFVERAQAVPPPPAKPPVSFGWYRRLLKVTIQGSTPRYMARAIVAGQLVCGFGLLLGFRPRSAAAIGLLQNLSFSLAGSSGHNPFMMLAQELLLLTPDDVARYGWEGWRRRR